MTDSIRLGGAVHGPWIKSKDGLFDYLVAAGVADDEVVRSVDEVGEDFEGLPFVISDATQDRDKDVISVSGWRLDNYRKNPVVLWAHDKTCLPVGKAVSVYSTPDALVAVDEFCDDHELGLTVKRLYQKGYLNAVSVGFLVSDAKARADGGFNILQKELLEHSAVPVPSNPNALIQARSVDGIDTRALRIWAEGVLGSLTAPAAESIKASVVEAAPLRFDFGAVAKAVREELSPARKAFTEELARIRLRATGSLG